MSRVKEKYKANQPFLHRINQRNNKGASEVVGTLLLIGIGVSLFSLLAVVTFTMPSVFFSEPTPSVNIIGRVEGSSVVFEHYGGKSLPLDTEITVMFAETRVVKTVGEVLDAASQSDGLWNIGEKIVIFNNNPNLPIMHISVFITHKESNTVVMRGILQEGSQAVNPIAVTLHADSITTNTARVHMFYDFRFYLGTKRVCFTYIRASEYTANMSAPWNSTGWVDVFFQNGSYDIPLVGLHENTEYYYQAWVQYNSSVNATQKVNVSGTIRMFRTDSYSSGMWHFDESSGLIAIDSSNHGNNGTLFPASSTQAPQRLDQSDDVVHNRSIRFDGYNDYVVVNNAASLSPTSEIALEAWVKPEPKDEWRGTQLQLINSTMYGTQTYGCLDPDIAYITDNRYVIVSRNADYDGFVITVEVSDNGTIIKNATTSVIDIYQFETVWCQTPRIVKVQGSTDVYAIVYRGPRTGANYYLYMATIRISSTGTITKPFLDKQPLDTVNCYYPDICFTEGDYYAVAYSSYEDFLAAYRFIGRLQTVEITSTGIITANVRYHNFGSSGVVGIMQYLDIIHVEDDYYSIFFRDSDTDGSLISVQIKNGYNLVPDSVRYKFDIDNISALPLRVIHVYDKIYGVLYGDKTGTIFCGGAITTLKLTNTGTLDAMIDFSTLLPPVDWTEFSDSDIIHINGDIFAMTYRLASRAEVKTFEISNMGIITNHTNDAAWKYIFQPTSSYTISSPKIIRVNPTIDPFEKTFAIVYPKTISYDINNDINNGVLLSIKIADNGSIGKKIYDSVLLGPVNFYAPDIVHISNDIYAVVGRKVLYGAMSLHTVQISNLGKIEKSFIDTLDIPMPEVTPGLSIKIVHVSNDIYLIGFNNNGNPLITLITVEIADNGMITDTVLCTYNITKFGHFNFCSPSILRIKDNIFAVSYHSTNYTSKSDFVSTFQILPNGTIILIDTLSMSAYFSTQYGSQYDEYSDIIQIEGSAHLYALVYGYDYFITVTNHRGLGIIITIEISDAGLINQTPVGIFTLDTYGCSRPDILHISNSTYVIAYSKSVRASNYQISGNLKTLYISPNGTSMNLIDAVTYSTINSNYDKAHCQFLTHLYKNVYALLYTIPSGSTIRGKVGTFSISENGSIYRTWSNAMFHVQLDLTATTNILPSFINITSNVIAICYQGNYDDGYIDTVSVTITDTSNELKPIISKAGSYEIKGNRTVFVASLRTTSGYKTLTLPVHPGWNFLVLTYDHLTLKFFNNLTNNTLANVTLPCNENIITSANPLIFGGFSGIYDEIAVYSMHLRDDEIYNHLIQY
ncbi:MAG: type IV pilin [Candidatus Thermoplasmatota archaeon]